MEAEKYNIVLEELWSEVQAPHKGRDVYEAREIYDKYRRRSMLAEIFRGAFERSSISRFNGKIYCFTGQIYEESNWRDMRNLVHDLMVRMHLSNDDIGDYKFSSYVILNNCMDVVEKTPFKIMPNIMVFKNCVVDTETREVHEFSRDYRQVTKVDYNYNPEAKTFLWYQFLNQVLPDKEKQKLLQQYLGAIFVDRDKAKIETMLILKGSGSNGKSVVFETIMGILGKENVSNFGIGALVGGGDRKYNISSMNGKRLNYCSELQISMLSKNSDSLKAIISGEPIECRKPFGQNFQATNIPLLMGNCNVLPDLQALDHGMIRRLCILPFEVTIEKKDQNKHLSADLRDEYAGIFNWILDGRDEFVKNGYHLPYISDLEDAVEEYQADFSTPLAFMKDVGFKRAYSSDVDMTPKWMSASSLYERYSSWCIKNSVDDVESKNKFTRTLTNAGFKRRRTSYGTQFGVFGKVTLKDLQTKTKVSAKIRKERIKSHVLIVDGVEYADNQDSLSIAVGVGVQTIRRMIDKGKFKNCTYRVGASTVYDINEALKVLNSEGKLMSKDEKIIAGLISKDAKYNRMLFNQAMEYHKLPFRKYANVPSNGLDGLVIVNEDMTIEEALEKAKNEDYTSNDVEINADDIIEDFDGIENY